MKLSRYFQALLFAALTLTGLSANAGLILTLQDSGGASASIADDDGDGFVMFNGALGTWLVNVSTGITNPLIGTANIDAIDLNSVNVSGGTGTLTVTLTRTGLDRSPAPFVASVGGTTQGLVSFATLLNGSVISSYSSSASAFSNIDSGGINVAGPYDLSLVATINHSTGLLISSFDYLVTVPEPAMVSLLGAGLVLVGFVGRRRTRKQA